MHFVIIYMFVRIAYSWSGVQEHIVESCQSCYLCPKLYWTKQYISIVIMIWFCDSNYIKLFHLVYHKLGKQTYLKCIEDYVKEEKHCNVIVSINIITLTITIFHISKNKSLNKKKFHSHFVAHEAEIQQTFSWLLEYKVNQFTRF